MVSAGALTSSDAALAAWAVAALAAKKLAVGLALDLALGIGSQEIWQLHWAQGPSQMREHLLHLGYVVPSARRAESAFKELETAASKRAAGNTDAAWTPTGDVLVVGCCSRLAESASVEAAASRTSWWCLALAYFLTIQRLAGCLSHSAGHCQ
jgi:hypothetical protein